VSPRPRGNSPAWWHVALLGTGVALLPVLGRLASLAEVDLQYGAARAGRPGKPPGVVSGAGITDTGTRFTRQDTSARSKRWHSGRRRRPRVRRRAHRRDACFTAAGMGEAATGLDRRASPAMNGLRRSGQLASLPLARRLSVVPAERRGEGVRRGVAGPVGDLGEGQLAGPQVVAGEGHPPVC
jgi:hypothetical protein